jgi:protein-L-isoaspartate(D-aspartate) O-methyltransferase
MQDNAIHQGLRKKLMAELKSKGISDSRILEAFWLNPRHWFIDPEFFAWAYKDTAFKIDSSQTISQPFTVAFMTSLLEVKPGEKILEIGTGSGYQACILNSLGAKVYTIERHEKLYQKASQLLSDIGHRTIRTLHGDGYKGAPRFAPFDKIIVTAGASDIPQTLLQQLKVGGRMVIPSGDEDTQLMYRIKKLSDSQYTKEEHGSFSFVPFLEGVV